MTALLNELRIIDPDNFLIRTSSLQSSIRHTIRVMLIIFLVSAGINPVNAQKDPCSTGVFSTEEDFIHNRLSYQINTAVEGYKLNFTFPADMTLTLKIITPDTAFKFPPGSIYGYSDCGRVYRYFEGGKELTAQQDFYKIEQAGGLILYSSEFISGNEIFYSTDLTSPIHRLTLRNLKNDFRKYPEFIAEAKRLKRRPDGLATRNTKGFLILKLYEEQGSLSTKQ